MIPPADINKFLHKPVTDHRWVKKLTIEQLDEALNSLDPKPQLHPALKQHQKACVLLGVKYPQFYHMLDLGTGKTLITLELLKYFWITRRIRRWALVLVPTEELAASWEDEIAKWLPTLRYVTLTGSTDDKWRSLTGFRSGLVIGTYSGVSIMCSELRKLTPKAKKRSYVPVKELIERFVANTDAVVCDQSTAVGNVMSLTYKVVRELSRDAEVRYNLAGRSFARDPIILWSQFYIMDRGLTLTPNFGFYREVFFDKKKAWFGGPSTYEYKFRRAMEPQLSRLLGNRSIRYSRDECIDLPPRRFLRRRVTFARDMQTHYQRIVQEVLSNRYTLFEMQNVFCRLRQVCSGFVGFKDGNENRVQFDFTENPKMDALLQLIDEMPEDSKAIVFYEFTHSAERISQELKKKRIMHGWLWSGTKNWREVKQAFDKDPAFKVLINQWKKGSLGLNLQAADYIFYFESPVSALYREESEGRNYRGGQTKPVVVYDIVVRNSIEETILSYHCEGNKIFKALVADPKLVLNAA